MVAFTSLLVLATAGLSAVSALALPKRNLRTDAVHIVNAMARLDDVVNSIDPADPAGSTAAISQTLSGFASILDNATASEQGGPEVSDAQVQVFMAVFKDFDILIGDIENAVPTIQSISGLADIMQSGLLTAEVATSTYINTVIPLLSPDLQSAAGADEQEILDSFQRVRGLLTAPSS